MDARSQNNIRFWITSLSLMQGTAMVVGVVLFFAGLFLLSGIVRALVLLTGSTVVAMAFVSHMRKGAEPDDVVDIPPTFEERESAMKKLVFDDFQSTGKQYRIEFVDDGEEHAVASIVEPPARETKTPLTPQNVEFRAEDFLESNGSESSNDHGARSEFRNVILRVLSVLKDVNFARTVCLYWVNRDKQQLVLEAHVSDSAMFTTHRRCEIGSDILSQVARTGKPQLVNYLERASQSDMLPYYDGAESVKTAVAVPIFYVGTTTPGAGPVAVLSLDCPESDAYGPETMGLLARFAKLISSLIQTYTDKYDMLMDSEVLRSLNRLRDQFGMDFSFHNVTRSVADEVSRLVPWDYVSMVVFDEVRKTWIVQHVLNRMNDAYAPVLSEVDIQRSVVGTVIQSGVPKIVDGVQAMTLPRFYQAERCESKGSLAIIPLLSVTRCYGAVVVESKDTKSYADADVRLLQRITEMSAWALEVISLMTAMDNAVALDETTGVLMRKHFLERLQEISDSIFRW
jgi:transcriptional regulator with GAF, ATPase, and Fis domain